MITKKYPTLTELEDALCLEISNKLSKAIKLSGYANMLVSGGSTPIGLFQKLSNVKLSWKDVNVGLVDERFVPPTHEKSNEKLVRENLLIGEAKVANFIGMVYDEVSRVENFIEASEQYRVFEEKIDVTLLGMGGDGHTASLFPNDLSSELGLSDDWTDVLINTTSDVEPFERISSSKYLLAKSKDIYLMITGANKWTVFNEAEEKGYPIASFLDTGIEVYFSA